MINHRVGRYRTIGLNKARLRRTFSLRECGTCMGLWVTFAPLVIAGVSPLQISAPRGALSIPVSGDSPIKSMTTENNVDLANEIGGLLRRLEAENSRFRLTRPRIP
jgi:hypothetical protein